MTGPFQRLQQDWFKIDPNFGTAEDMKTLVQETHNNGLAAEGVGDIGIPRICDMPMTPSQSLRHTGMTSPAIRMVDTWFVVDLRVLPDLQSLETCNQATSFPLLDKSRWQNTNRFGPLLR